ncbi:MAG: PAS domain-containing sensor histidine kinase [Hyphomicrobiaceae bacterium]|nr:PAS domain-containing sensor histidine kinase [Hyphomicrobiaceae bacterium]
MSKTGSGQGRSAEAPGTVPRNATPLLNPGDRVFWLGLVVVVLSLIAALATYAILTGLTSISPSGDVVLTTLLVNAVLILAMFGVIGWQLAGLVRAWRDKVPGARLQVRVVALFSLIAVLPAVLLALAAANTFSRSLDGWFAKRTREIIDNSGEVARAYIDVHGQLIRTDILNMARDVGATIGTDGVDTSPPKKGLPPPDTLKTVLLAQTTLRDLPVGHIIDKDGRKVASAFDEDTVPFTRPPAEAIRRAEAGEVPLLDSSATSRVYAVAKLAAIPQHYLYVARELSAPVVAQIRRTQQNTDEFQRLRAVSRNLKIAHGLLYFMIASTALLAAIWAGLWFAARFVSPIRRLIEGAELVSQGDLTVALPEKRGEGDLRRFSATFNKMTRELKHQRDALVSVNSQLEDRRRFTEAVLSGVSAGVIGLGSDGRITLVSPSAERLLALENSELIGHRLEEVLPEFAVALASKADGGGKHRTAREASRMVGTNERTFAVEMTREQAGDAIVGSVVTFDDVTDLAVAQRTAAWADVARRIAHEIKNPLTPIQLSAERIKRKYGKEITSDRETFDKLTDAISRQVDVIKSMVDEFASFARLPQPSMEMGDIREVVHGPVVLFRESHPAIEFVLDIPSSSVVGSADRRLLAQAVTNLTKNATEAVDAMAQSPEKPDGWRGRIEVRMRREPDRCVIEVIDNGIGLPKQNRAKLLEPYVTTRAKGTGLGLAIVQKIVEQHKGTLELDDAPVGPGRDRGARVRLTLPLPFIAMPAFAPQLNSEADDRAVMEARTSIGQRGVGSDRAATIMPEPMLEPAVAPDKGRDAVNDPTSNSQPAPQTIPSTNDPRASLVAPRERPRPPVNIPVTTATLAKNSGRVMPRPESRTKGARP